MPKIYMDHIKRPDKALLKKHLTTDRFASNYGSSDSQNRLQNNTGSLLKLSTNRDNWMVSEFTKDMKQIDDEFNKLRRERFANKTLSKTNIKNYNSIIYIHEKKNPKRTKFKHKKSSYVMHDRSDWKKFRMLDKVYFKWIQEMFLFDIEILYKPGVIRSLTRPNIK